MSNMRFKLFFFVPLLLLVLTGVCVSFQTAHAATCSTGAGGFVPLECFDDSDRLRDAYSTEELGPFLQKVFAGAIALGALLAVLRLAWAGFMYMSSDLWSAKGKAREVITDTLLGLFLLLAIYIILSQINPQILSLKVDAPQLLPLPQTPTSNIQSGTQPPGTFSGSDGGGGGGGGGGGF